MILSRIEMTNYKQYGGHHEIDIPQVGAIGVIGANGVGKTTLFEAIEWALYSPSSLKAADVKPRVWRGKTEVKVTIDDPTTGTRYTVERELGKGSAKAQVYRVDANGFEERVVDGAGPVTEYVTKHLIGLDHAAFVATFFTRQKELGFFNGSPTARRRDVGKLLGLETIRTAQQLIADDRKKAQADARSYREQSESQLRDRDFESEIAASEQRVVGASVSLQETGAHLDRSRSATGLAQASLIASEKVRDQDTALAQQALQSRRTHDVAAEQVAHATRELDRLTGLAAERQRLEPVAVTVGSLEAEEEQHTSARQRALRMRELQQMLTSLMQRDGDAASSMREAIANAPAPDGDSAWHAGDPDTALTWAHGIDLPQIERDTQAIGAALEADKTLIAETQRLAAYQKRAQDLHAAERTMLESGDPVQLLAAVQTRLQELHGSTAAATNTANRVRQDLQKTERVLTSLHAQREGEVCPTCQRPFTADDTAHMITVFEREAELYRQQLRQIEAQLAANREALAAAQRDEQSFAKRQEELTATRASIASGNHHLQEQQAKVDDCAFQLSEMLELLGRESVPTDADLDRARRELNAWRKVAEAAAIVARAQRTRTQIAAERVPVETELTSLADVSYDEPRHREVAELLQRARQAATTIERIDKDLARRDEMVQARALAVAEVTAAQQAMDDLARQRVALGFDLAQHQQVQQAVQAAQQQERVASEQRHAADVAVREADHALKAVVAEKERVGKLAILADEKQRAADDLDQMYREFTEFERYAAAWYAPRLGEITSDLVAQVTDGKYDRVEFDSNFSIQVYDGDDEKFPYETFSGGERDAIALCARIALSRVIGGASATPPGFLVLDEVFGSLDLERRQRLLEMLAAITGADDHFRQVFIISHVDDVRTSPILDDIWRVVETDGGTSELQLLGVGADIGEL